MTPAEIQLERARLQNEFKVLDDDKWLETPALAQQRGRDFESLVLDLFQAMGILIRRSYHTADNSAEQIDGAIRISGRVALLECKWVKADLAASDLFSFVGKVDGKFLGTIGIFVSRNELSQNFLAALRSGRRQSVVVVHGKDVDDMFSPTYPLKEYLEAHLDHISIDNLHHFPTARFQAKFNRSAEAVVQDQPAGPGLALSGPVKQTFSKTIEKPAAKNLVREFANEFTDAQRAEAAKWLVENFKTIVSVKSKPDTNWKGDNLEKLLQQIVALLPQEWTAVDHAYFIDELSPDFQDRDFHQLLLYFAERYQHVTNADRETIENRLLQQWGEATGIYDAENLLAVPTGKLWPHLSFAAKKNMIKYLIEIILSDRWPNFPQYRLAATILTKEHNSLDVGPEIHNAFVALVKQTAKPWVDAGWNDADARKRIIGTVTKANERMRPFIANYEAVIEAAVQEVA